MAGHSKWDNIKHRKATQDSIRSKEFAKFSKEIIVAAKMGGPDINTNSSLKLAVQKAKARSMPSKNIQKAIDKATGANSDNIDYKETVYEGYLPNGISIMVMCLFDNHNRVSSSVKSYFNNCGGTLGKNGSVSYLFERKGILAFNNNIGDEESIMMHVLEFGAEDFENNQRDYIVTTNPSNFTRVKENLEQTFKDIKFTIAEVTYEPNQLIKLDKERANKIIEIIEKFEDDEDIQEVFHNLDPASFN